MVRQAAVEMEEGTAAEVMEGEMGVAVRAVVKVG